MKFKVGDIVRPTRDYLINSIENNTIDHLEYINGFQVLEIKDDRIFYYINEKNAFYKAEHLELVPEEPEFQYGEEIEVSCDEIQREKRTFLTKINGNAIFPYVCVADYSYDNFINGSVFSTRDRKYARKLK